MKKELLRKLKNGVKKFIQIVFSVLSGLTILFTWLKFSKRKNKDTINKENKEIEKTIKNNDDWLASNKSYRDSNSTD